MFTMQALTADPPPASISPGDEARLVQRAQRDLAAFTDLYRQYASRVYRFLLVRTGNEQDAQDLTSQTFLAAMESLGNYSGDYPFAAWLFGIARHKLADFYRRRRPEARLTAAAGMANGDMLDEQVGRHLQVEQVARKLGTLSPDRAEALSLRFFAGLEVAEIAHLMQKNEPAVRMLVHRGLRDLQAQLHPDREETS